MMNKVNIIPGKGVGALCLGQSLDEVLGLVGQPYKMHGPEMALDDYISAGYLPEDELIFLIGFDLELCFDRPKRGPYPISALYFKKGKLIYIRLSQYSLPRNAKLFNIPGGLTFNDNLETMIKVLGDSFSWAEDFDEDEEEECTYQHKGVSLIFQQDKIAAIDIFNPLDLLNLN